MPHARIRESSATSPHLRPKVILAGLAAGWIALFLFSFVVGRFPIGLSQVIRIVASSLSGNAADVHANSQTVVLAVRLPRILAALLVGGALAAGGAAYQTLLRNPLVSPSLLGVSAGAAFGATGAMLLSWSRLAVQGSAFAAGLIAVGCTLFVARCIHSQSLTVLVLAGVVMSAFFEALVSFIKYAADPIDKLPAITFWLLGGLAKVANEDVLLGAPVIVGALALLYAFRWQVNVAGLGDDEARTLGVPVRAVRMLVILATTLLTAPAVSLAGIVGWIGLLVPHVARMVVGPRFEYTLPASFLIGGIFLLLVDDLVRTLPVEVPLGAVTALAGAPAFLFLMMRIRGSWS
jgi:iron complex transport system permease protein